MWNRLIFFAAHRFKLSFLALKNSSMACCRPKDGKLSIHGFSSM